MWNAFVQRRNGGGYDERLQLIELSDDDCKLLVAAGLKVQKGASPRDLYCFQNLPAYYDGTPLQVLRLLEEVKAAGRKVRRSAEAETATSRQETTATKRQRLSGSGRRASASLVPTWATSKGGASGDDESNHESSALPELIKITPSTGAKRLASPVKGRGSVMYDKISTPVKPSLATPTKSSGTPNVARRSHRTSMKIDVVSMQEETPTSSRKRKSESGGSRSTSPLAALFSPTNIRTPSPGLKTRRSSVLKQFETPEAQSTGNETPQTVPAPPKRFSTTTTQYTVTTTTTSDVDDESEELSDVDGAPEDEERACCDVKSVMEPILDALQRTSSRFQNAWEEYSKVTPTSMKTTTTKTN